MPDWLTQFISFADFGSLVPLVLGSLAAGAILAVVAGLIGPMVQARDMAFAVHGMSELSFAGASAALLAGVNLGFGAVGGSLVAAVVLAFLGIRARDRNSIIGILLPFGLGLGVLFTALYQGNSSNKFGLLVGQIVSVDNGELITLSMLAIVVIAALVPLWRPLYFSAVDPVIAEARGVPVRVLSTVFLLLLALVCAMTVQLVGALLVMSLLITPTAAAAKVTARPSMLVLLSVVFALVSMEGGILLSLSPGLPVSPYVTTVSFLIYLVCALIGHRRHYRRSPA